MPDIHAGVITMQRDDMGRYLRLQEKERITAIHINRRGNPPFLVFDTNLGKARHFLQLVPLSLAMHLPPMHQVTDVWFVNTACFLRVQGATLPAVAHGKDVPDVPFKVETVEGKPGRPEFQRGRFAA